MVMRDRSMVRTVVAATMSLCGTAVACQPRTQPAPVSAVGGQAYCWSVFRTAQSVDTVADRMARAATEAGFRQPKIVRAADTARVVADPQLLVGGPPSTAFIAKVVAYPLGDSVRVRFEAGWVVPQGGWATPSDSLSARAEARRICDALSSATG